MFNLIVRDSCTSSRVLCCANDLFMQEWCTAEHTPFVRPIADKNEVGAIMKIHQQSDAHTPHRAVAQSPLQFIHELLWSHDVAHDVHVD